jgi:hypothetical protein
MGLQIRYNTAGTKIMWSTTTVVTVISVTDSILGESIIL